MEKLPKTLPSESFRTKFQAQLDLDQFKDAREARNRLKKAGCDLSYLLAHLEMFCSHVIVKVGKRARYSGQIQEVLNANATLVADAEELTDRLSQDADRTERINRAPEFLRELTWYTDERRLKQLPDDLRLYASWLKSAVGKVRSPFPIPIRDQPGQVIRSAAAHIRSVTGEDRLSDLASLVRVAYAAHGTDKDIDANALGKVVTRARQRMKKRIKRRSD